MSRAVPLCLGAAALWGLWWMPIRALEGAGLPGPWAGLAMTLGSLPVLMLGVWWRGGALGPLAALGAVAVGAAVTLYGNALTLTDVVRAVLLFYLAPAWSTAIECLFLGRRWRWRSALAIGLSFAGVALIFRGEASLLGWGAGDVMALGSGLAWSVGAALIYADRVREDASLALVAAVSAAVAGGVFAILAAPVPAVPPDAVPLVLGSGALFLAPILGVTLWAAITLPPATISFLLTAEIVVGVASAAAFLDEPFGWPEALGAVLIGLGAVVEVFGAGGENGQMSDDSR